MTTLKQTTYTLTDAEAELLSQAAGLIGAIADAIEQEPKETQVVFMRQTTDPNSDGVDHLDMKKLTAFLGDKCSTIELKLQ